MPPVSQVVFFYAQSQKIPPIESDGMSNNLNALSGRGNRT